MIHYSNFTDSELACLYSHPEVIVIEKGLKVNDYLMVLDQHGTMVDKMRVNTSGDLAQVPFIAIGKGRDSFKPLNPEQECAFDLMANTKIPIKVVVGMAGTGKTKIALKFGLEMLAKEKVSRILIVRNPDGVGKSLGFYKGDKMTKMMNWNNPVKDNVSDQQLSLEEMIDKGDIELDVVETMKGRDIKDTWIIVDEAEDLTEEQIKMVGERVSAGSYICIIGDLNQVTHKEYKKSSGLKRLTNLHGIPEFGYVELTEDVRSATSKIFATRY